MANKSSVSHASTYAEIGAFWDEHDSTEFGGDDEADVAVRLDREQHYFAMDRTLYLRVRMLAQERGVSEETLANLFIQERLDDLERDKDGEREPAS
jgi:hypothetical protein